jgi:hypothetical protein
MNPIFASARFAWLLSMWAGGSFLLAGCGEGRWSWSDRKSGGGLFDRQPRETWTIECAVVSDRDHRTFAEELAEGLRNVRNLRRDKVSVEHQDDRSIVYYGSYDLAFDRRSDEIILSPQIRGDWAYIRELALAPDQYPFLLARPVPRPTSTIGPPEWNLENAEGVYTLQIGVLYNTPNFHERREAAVEWVRDLRNRGYQAFYFHSPDKPQSLVTVGAFDESAVLQSGPGRQYYSEEVESLRSREEFAYNLENGHKIYVTGEDGRRTAARSVLVRIPRKSTPVPMP